MGIDTSTQKKMDFHLNCLFFIISFPQRRASYGRGRECGEKVEVVSPLLLTESQSGAKNYEVMMSNSWKATLTSVAKICRSYKSNLLSPGFSYFTGFAK